MNDSPKNLLNSTEVKIKIKSSNILENPSQRKDCYGNVISKKIKKHKICFPDNLENKKDLAEVHIVSSYKHIYENSKMYYHLANITEEWSCYVF